MAKAEPKEPAATGHRWVPAGTVRGGKGQDPYKRERCAFCGCDRVHERVQVDANGSVIRLTYKQPGTKGKLEAEPKCPGRPSWGQS